MKYLAPAVITAVFSWVLYRQKGTWSPVEVYPSADYSRDAKYTTKLSGKREPHLLERSIDLLEERKFGGVVNYPEQRPGGVGFSADRPIKI